MYVSQGPLKSEDPQVVQVGQLRPPNRNNDPIVVIGKEEGEVKRESWIEDNKVVTYEDCGHILHDLASTRV